MRLYRTREGAIVEDGGLYFALPEMDWDKLVNLPELRENLTDRLPRLQPLKALGHVLAPIASQEVWAAGVTYFRSREARMNESNTAGGSDFYDRVYSAQRPELFFKATPNRVRKHGGQVQMRPDSRWTIPEPELTLLVNSQKQIIGYTIGNDMSCRDIEGENPLYLPQAKVYWGSCALGPGILLAEDNELPPETAIAMQIIRAGEIAFSGATTLSQMKRRPQELVQYLYRANRFPAGCFLMTGTGVVPPDSFTLRSEERRVGKECRSRWSPYH